MRESYSYLTDKKNKIEVPNSQFQNKEYLDYTENSDSGAKLSSKMMVRNDPKFQSQYNFEADERIILPLDK